MSWFYILVFVGFVGGSAMTDDQLQECILRAKKRSSEVITLIDEVLDGVNR